MATLDPYVIALDRRTGRVVWETKMAEYKDGYTGTHAPLVVKDKVLVGAAGGEYGIRGFVDAYRIKDGTRAWRTYTVPGPGEFGHDTWEGDSWKSGGAAIWLTGSYDPDLNLTYWGASNPGPDGFYYVLDRATGEFLHAQPFVKQTWAKEIGRDGRPVVVPGTDPSPKRESRVAVRHGRR